MEELLRRQFEAQFGDEWSQPVVGAAKPAQDAKKPAGSDSDADSDAGSGSGSASDSDKGSSDASEDEPDFDSDQPITVKHSESHAVTHMQHRRQFMSAKAPREAEAPTAPKTKEDEQDLKDDVELQRLISESHILDAHKGFSGADISYGDPLEHIGKSRLAIMQQRLESAGGKQLKQNTPMKIAKGIKAKAKHRDSVRRADAKENGVILEKKQKEKRKRVHDKGLKINSVGKSTAHGIELSQRDISRVRKKRR